MPESGIPSPEFMEAYWAALAALDDATDNLSSGIAPREESIAWLLDQFQRSAKWRAYDPLTQMQKRSVLGRWAASNPELPFRKLRKADIEKSRDKRAATPSAANMLVKNLNVMFGWAVSARHLTINPASGVAKLATIEKGAHTWTAGEVAIYRAKHPIGTQARLALELMLQVGARISDAAKLGRQHEYDQDGERWIGFTAHKNRNRKPVRIDQPMRDDLREAIRACNLKGDLTYLVTERGSAFTIKGLGNKFRDWCDEAGLFDCSAHGLRKASATELAEDSATPHQLMAWFGWTKIETALVYTRAADRKRLSRSVSDLREHRRNKSVSLSDAKKAGETIRAKNHE